MKITNEQILDMHCPNIEGQGIAFKNRILEAMTLYSEAENKVLVDKAKERLEYWDIARDVNAKLEAENKGLRSDLEYHVKNRSELTEQLAEVHLYNKKMQRALEIMGVSITKEK